MQQWKLLVGIILLVAAAGSLVVVVLVEGIEPQYRVLFGTDACMGLALGVALVILSTRQQAEGCTDDSSASPALSASFRDTTVAPSSVVPSPTHHVIQLMALEHPTRHVSVKEPATSSSSAAEPDDTGAVVCPPQQLEDSIRSTSVSSRTDDACSVRSSIASFPRRVSARVSSPASQSCPFSAQTGTHSSGRDSCLSYDSSWSSASPTRSLEASTVRARKLGSVVAALKGAADTNTSILMRRDIRSSRQKSSRNLDMDNVLRARPLPAEELQDPRELTFHSISLQFLDPHEERKYQEGCGLQSRMALGGLILAVVASAVSPIAWTTGRRSLSMALLAAVPMFFMAYVCLRAVSLNTFATHLLQLWCVMWAAICSLVYELYVEDHEIRSLPQVREDGVSGPVMTITALVAAVTLILRPFFWWGVADAMVVVVKSVGSSVIAERRNETWTSLRSASLLVTATGTAALLLYVLHSIELQKRRSYASCTTLRLSVKHCSAEQQRTLQLMENCVPRRVFEALLTRDSWMGICAQMSHSIVVATDLANFTTICSSIPAHSVVRILNQVYTNCDYSAKLYGVEKVKTLGDGWIGAIHPATSDREYLAAADMALVVLGFMEQGTIEGISLTMRIGIGHGRTLTGVAGVVRPQYEILGEGMKEANLMEATALPGTAQVSEGVAAQIENHFVLDSQTSGGPGHLLVRRISHGESYALGQERTPPVRAISRAAQSTSASSTSAFSLKSIFTLLLGRDLQALKEEEPAVQFIGGTKLGGASVKVVQHTFALVNSPHRITSKDPFVSNFNMLSGSLTFQYAFDELLFRAHLLATATRRCMVVYSAMVFVVLVAITSNVALVERGTLMVALLSVVGVVLAALLGVAVLVTKVGAAAPNSDAGPPARPPDIPIDETDLKPLRMVKDSSLLVCTAMAAFPMSVFAAGRTPVSTALVMLLQVVLTLAIHPTAVLKLKSAMTVLAVLAGVISLIFSTSWDATSTPDAMLFVAFGFVLAACLSTAYQSELAKRETWRQEMQLSIQQCIVDNSVDLAEQILGNTIPPEVLHGLHSDCEVVHEVEVATVGFLTFDGVLDLDQHFSSPAVLMAELNHFLGELDTLLDKYPMVQKLKNTPYVVVSGCPHPTPDHALSVMRFMMDVMTKVKAYNRGPAKAVKAKAGVHTGRLGAGILGTTNFAYDVFGDSANMASRLSSHGIDGRVQVSERTRQLTKGALRYEERGKVHLKGKGEVMCYLLMGELRSPANDPSLPGETGAVSPTFLPRRPNILRVVSIRDDDDE